MQLLDEIVADAVNDQVKIAVILRKAMVLASRVKNQGLRAWARCELDGYGSGQALPDYRVIRIMAKGDFASWRYTLKGHPLPSVLMHPEHRHWAETARLGQGIMAYEQLLASNHAGSVAVQWQQELVMLYADSFIDDASMLRAWQEIPASSLHELIDTVRNRMLQLALDLQNEMGTAGIEKIAPEKVQEAVVSNIFHGNVVIANSISGGVKQVGQKVVVKGDFNSLAAALKEKGIPDEAVTELDEALRADKSSGGFGARVGAWIANRGNALGDGLSAGVITQMILIYLGMAG